MNRPGLSRLLWRVSLPIMFAQLSEIVLHVTNTMFLARVGVTQLAAIGIADSIWEIFLVVPMGLVDGIQILTARYLGRGRPAAAGAVFRHGLLLALLVSAALAAGLRVATPWVANALVSSRAVGGATAEFLHVACLGLPLTAASFALSALLVSVGRTRALVPATLVLAGTNIALDYVLIFGKLGSPALGIRGAAWSSVFAELASVSFLIGYVVVRGHARRFRLFRWRRWSLPVFRRLARISAPVSLQALVEGLRWLVFFLIIERVGALALAAANIIYSCYAVLRIPTEAFGETACSMVSRVIGRSRDDRIEPVIQRSILAAALATLPLIALVLLAPDGVLSMFTLDPSVIAAGRASLRVVALAMLVIIPGQMWFTAVLGTGDTPAALGIEVVFATVMVAASYWTAIQLSWPLELVWASFVVGWAVVLAASYAWMKSGGWRRAVV